jgi:hypothetical protein
MIPPYGARGSAAVTAVLELGLALMYGLALARELPGLRAGWELAPRLALALAVAFAVGLPLLLLHPVLATLAGATAYLAVLWLLKAVPPELLDAVLRRSS